LKRDEILHPSKLGVTSELASLQHLTFIISLGNTPSDMTVLVCALETLAENTHKLLPTHIWMYSPDGKQIYLQIHPSSFIILLAFPLAKPSSPKQKRSCERL
jgi:hypothetical protein